MSIAPLRRSLRGKALLASLAGLLYLVLAVGYVSVERGRLYDDMRSLETIAEHEKLLALTDAAVSGAVVDASEASSAAHAELPSPLTMALYIESCRRQFDALETFDPSYTLLRRSIDRAWAALQASADRSGWIELRETLSRIASGLEIRRAALAEERERLNRAYRHRYDAVTIESLLLAIVGFVGFGTAGAWFFARLALDIRRLESHAQQIVRGTRGVTLAVRREDELGELMHAVNRMSEDLDERERRIELDGERRSHQEKMLAVAALASGVAHEVNNPLAVISGIAQELRSGAEPLPVARQQEIGQALQAHAQRAAQAARQLSDVAAPQAPELDWVDVNDVLRHAIGLMGYDKRYRHLRFELQADPSLPAVRTSGTALQQVVMQLLALTAVPGTEGAAAVVQVDTGVADGRAWVRWRWPEPLGFQQPAVQRSLLLSRALIEPIGGQLAFGQEVEGGQRITLSLPLDVGRAAEG